MSHPKISKEEMLSRVIRFSDYTREKAVPLMFIDSLIPGHHRLNFAVIGDTASENPDYDVMMSQPHKFQIGMFKAMPNGNGPAYHTHDYVELFLPLEGKWRFYWGNDPETDPEGEVFLEKWDLISFPPGLWRGFENIDDQPAWCFAVLEQHEVFEGRDPYWSPKVIRKAAEYGFKSDADGRMIKPDNFDELNAQLLEEMYNAGK
ncbi:MAG: cupin domain-containing protein [Ardenticatenaceae bacterium]|nr:cupin domain-containing protein [Ardenticatenaceae bacterium]